MSNNILHIHNSFFSSYQFREMCPNQLIAIDWKDFLRLFFFFGVYCFITVPLLLVREMRESACMYISGIFIRNVFFFFFCAFPQIRFMTHIHLTLLGVCRAYIVVVLIDSLFTLGKKGTDTGRDPLIATALLAQGYPMDIL